MTANGIVQAKLIGRFGNQLHQYAAARAYAEFIGARLEVEPWIGQEIFGLTEPRWSRELFEVNGGCSGLPPELMWGQTNVRLGGYFQTQRWVSRLSKARLQEWLQIRPDLLRVCNPLVGAYTAAHMRQGDYVGHPLYANVSADSYSRACVVHGLQVDVWVREDTPHTAPGLDPRMAFLPDFITLMWAKRLLRANSTFSWWAAALGNGDVYAPVVTDRVGPCDVDFVRGNWPRCADTSRVGVQIDDLHLPA